MQGVLLVSTWLIGIAGGVGVTLGSIGLLTGRVVWTPRRLNWSVGEAKVMGLGLTITALLFAIYGLVGGLVLSTGGGPNWRGPDWWNYVQLASPVAAFGFPTLMLLLEQHNKRRWPFKSSADQTSRLPS
jgi:hypothetical protein